MTSANYQFPSYSSPGYQQLDSSNAFDQALKYNSFAQRDASQGQSAAQRDANSQAARAYADRGAIDANNMNANLYLNKAYGTDPQSIANNQAKNALEASNLQARLGMFKDLEEKDSKKDLAILEGQARRDAASITAQGQVASAMLGGLSSGSQSYRYW